MKQEKTTLAADIKDLGVGVGLVRTAGTLAHQPHLVTSASRPYPYRDRLRTRGQ